MATQLPPLEYDLSGIPNVSLSGGGVNAADPGVQAEAAFRQNAARRLAWRQANGVTPEMLARANSFGAAPSTPLPHNPAPVATADAAAAPSFGARVASAAEGGAARSGLLRGLLGRFGLYGAALDGGYEAGKILTPAPVAVGLADAVGTLAQKLGFNNSYAGGSAQYGAADARGDMTPGAVAAKVAPAPAPAAAAPAPSVTNPDIMPLGPDATAAANRLFFNGTSVPADGTGYIRNETTGAVTAVDSRNAPQRVTRYTGAAPVAPALSVPTLGTNGGIFENLADYANHYGPATLAAAQASRGTKVAFKQAELGIKANDSAANRENQAATAQANTTRGYADLLKAMTEAQKPNVKVTAGLDGTPIITDLMTGKSTKSTPAEKPSWEKFRDAAKADPGNKAFTEDQLKAYYNRTYGG